eukprot:971024-Amphidinium_carterae.1
MAKIVLKKGASCPPKNSFWTYFGLLGVWRGLLGGSSFTSVERKLCGCGLLPSRNCWETSLPKPVHLRIRQPG